MNCTEQNTAVISVASYTNTDWDKTIGQVTKSARKFNYFINFTKYRDPFSGWIPSKWSETLKAIPKFMTQGIKYLLWVDASDSVFVSPFSQFIAQAQQMNLPETSLLCAADWNTPYTIGLANDEPALVSAGYASNDKPTAYCCLGLIFGHINAWRETGQKIINTWQQNSGNPNKLASQYGYEKFNELTRKGFNYNCDQTMVHLLLKDNPLCVIPDMGQYLLSNYLGKNSQITLDQMRQPQTKENAHLGINQACVIHGSPTFRKGAPLENFINKL